MRNSVGLWWPLVALLAVTPVAGCGDGASKCTGDQRPARNGASVTISEGLWGDVWFWSGDFMPICPSGTVRPAVREVVVFAAATEAEVTEAAGSYGFYEEVRTTEIARTVSDRNGFFQIALPPGEYSLFVIEQAQFYAHGGYGSAYVSGVSVGAGAVTAVPFNIDYLASW